MTQLLGAGQPHDFFYSNATVVAAYKNYVKTFVSRYVNEPTILAWEVRDPIQATSYASAHYFAL